MDYTVKYTKLLKEGAAFKRQCTISELKLNDIIEVNHAMLMIPLYDKVVYIGENYVKTEKLKWLHYEPFKVVKLYENLKI